MRLSVKDLINNKSKINGGWIDKKRQARQRNKSSIDLCSLIWEGESIEVVSQEIVVHRSSIYRKLNRNSSKFGYRPDFASQQYLMRRRRRSSKIERNKALEKAIIEKLKEGWSHNRSPVVLIETDRNRLFHMNQFTPTSTISFRITSNFKFLRKKRRIRYPRVGRKRHKDSKEKVSIPQRSSSINARESFGHWGGDLILFSKTRENMFTLRERKTKFPVGIKNATRHSGLTSKTLISYMHDKAALVDSIRDLCKTSNFLKKLRTSKKPYFHGEQSPKD